MTRNEAIDLLLCRTSPLPAETDPVWEELVVYLEEHPDLAEWFSKGTSAEQHLHAAIQGVELSEQPKALPKPSRAPITSRRSMLRIAASFAVLGSGAAAWLGRPIGYHHADGAADYAAFCEDMCVFADRLLRLDHQSRKMPELNQWLAERSMKVPESLPGIIPQQVTKGCKVVNWGSNKVSLICFTKPDASVVHIFTLPKSALSGQPSADEMARPRMVDGREIVGWADADVVNILLPAKRGTSTKELLA
jgi:hypothetical protein